MRELLAMVMAKRVGQVVTLELAVEMVKELFPDLSHDPSQFGVLEYCGYLIQCERLADVLPELHPLHEQHWHETEKARIGVTMNPDYEHMLEQERAGKLIQFTAREPGGTLVGNMRVILYRDTHAQRLCCREDTLFIMPAHRGGFLAVRLWQFVEEAVVKRLGVREIHFSSKLSNGADRLAKYLKYRPSGLEFIKVFNDAGDPVSQEVTL